MWDNFIKNLDPNRIDEDQLNGLKTMLEQEAFKPLHAEIEKIVNAVERKNKDVPVVGPFKLTPGKFYLTKNHSIVFLLQSVPGISEEGVFSFVVISGGYVDPDFEGSELAEMLYGSFKIGHIFYATCIGHVVAALDEDDYPMHIMKELPPHKAIDIALG